jgi:Protein of unknown function (DUF229)
MSVRARLAAPPVLPLRQQQRDRDNPALLRSPSLSPRRNTGNTQSGNNSQRHAATDNSDPGISSGRPCGTPRATLAGFSFLAIACLTYFFVFSSGPSSESSGGFFASLVNALTSGERAAAFKRSGRGLGRAENPSRCVVPTPPPDTEWRKLSDPTESARAHGVAYASSKHTYRHWDFQSRCADRANLSAVVDPVNLRLRISGCPKSDLGGQSSGVLGGSSGNSGPANAGSVADPVAGSEAVPRYQLGDVWWSAGCDASQTPPAKAVLYTDSDTKDVVPAGTRVVQVWCARSLKFSSEGIVWGLNPNYIWRTVVREPSLAELPADEQKARRQSPGRVAAGGKRPVKVALLLLDSVSQRHFSRSTPLFNATVSGLERDGLAKTFSFDLLHVVGWNSNENQVPIMAGVFWRNLKKPKKGDVHCNSLWSAFRNDGFVTAHAEHGHWFPALKYFEEQVSFCKTRAKREKQRKQSPDIVLDKRYWLDEKWGCARTVEPLTGYLQSLIEARADERLFVSSYIPDSHSNFSPLYVTTMDRPLSEFYASVGRRSDTIIVLIADHGLHFGPHLESFEGQVEHKLPVLKITVPTALLAEHPDLERKLAINSKRLVTQYDVHASMLRLSRMFGTDPAHSLPKVETPTALSFVDAEVPEDRTCEDAGVPEAVCVCGGWEEVEVGAGEEKVVDRVIAYLNGKTSAVKACDKIALVAIVSFERKSFKRQKRSSGELARVRFHAAPESAASKAKSADAAFFEAVVYRRSTGGYDWYPELTGDVDVHHVHRLSPMHEREKEAMRGDLTAAEAKKRAPFPMDWCLVRAT